MSRAMDYSIETASKGAGAAGRYSTVSNLDAIYAPINIDGKKIDTSQLIQCLVQQSKEVQLLSDGYTIAVNGRIVCRILKVPGVIDDCGITLCNGFLPPDMLLQASILFITGVTDEEQIFVRRALTAACKYIAGIKSEPEAVPEVQVASSSLTLLPALPAAFIASTRAFLSKVLATIQTAVFPVANVAPVSLITVEEEEE